jgi:hypothetical protein
MTLPARAWIDTTPGDPTGSMENWDGDTITVQDMMDAFLTAMAELFLASTLINGYSVWTYADPDADPVFRAAESLSITGTSTSVNQAKAVQTTYSMLDTEGEVVKLTTLDAPVVSFERFVGLSALTADEAAWVNIFASVEWAFSSRNGAKPNIFRQRSSTLNEKLRREYHMQ